MSPTVLAELMGGKCYPFGPLEGAYHGDERRRARHDDRGLSGAGHARHSGERRSGRVRREQDAAARPGRSMCCCRCRWSREEVERIGAREGWRAKTFGRGMQGQKPFFHVIEFWLENRLMIEVASPAMAREYQEFLKNSRTEVMSDPESVRLMRATHIKEPA